MAILRLFSQIRKALAAILLHVGQHCKSETTHEAVWQNTAGNDSFFQHFKWKITHFKTEKRLQKINHFSAIDKRTKAENGLEKRYQIEKLNHEISSTNFY